MILKLNSEFISSDFAFKKLYFIIKLQVKKEAEFGFNIQKPKTEKGGLFS